MKLFPKWISEMNLEKRWSIKVTKNLWNSYSNGAPTNNRMCPIYQNGERKPIQCDKFEKGGIKSRLQYKN
jgi:hypothetical protein